MSYVKKLKENGLSETDARILAAAIVLQENEETENDPYISGLMKKAMVRRNLSSSGLKKLWEELQRYPETNNDYSDYLYDLCETVLSDHFEHGFDDMIDYIGHSFEDLLIRSAKIL